MSMTTNFWGDRNSQDAVNSDLQVSSRLSKPSSGFDQFLQSLLVRVAGETEPKIWQTSRGNGVTIWNTYDPTTQESATFTTETEVRSWLGQRYYR